MMIVLLLFIVVTIEHFVVEPNSFEFHKLSNCSVSKYWVADWFSAGRLPAQAVCFDERNYHQPSLCDSWAFCLQLSKLIQNKLPSVVHNSRGGFQKSLNLLSEAHSATPKPQTVSAVGFFNIRTLFMLNSFQISVSVRNTVNSGMKQDYLLYNVELLCIDNTAVRWSSNCMSGPSQILNQKRRLNFWAPNAFPLRL